MILAVVLIRGNAGILLVAGGAVALARWYALGALLRGCAAPLWQMRWLFLAIALMHVWLPGAALSLETLWLGPVHNILSLAVLILAVDTLRCATPRADLLNGLLWWSRPLSRLGLPAEQFAIRLWLTMELIPQQQQELSGLVRKCRRRVSLEMLGKLLQRAIFPAQDSSPREIVVPCDVPGPLPGEWLWPVLLLVLFAASGQWI